MYIVCKKKMQAKKVLLEVATMNGFAMNSRSNGFYIDGDVVKNLRVINRNLARPLVTKKVLFKYNKLINRLTELLISDDEEGDTFREALNHIEKFRLEIKNRYRKFLKQKELEMMSAQLKVLKKEAMNRLVEINNSLQNGRVSGKGR